MKNLLFLSVFLFCFQIVFSQEIKLEGKYYGEDLYVMNPSGDCVEKITVNGKEIEANTKSFSFGIDLSELKMYEKVVVILQHKRDCKPDVINTAKAIQKNNLFVVTKSGIKGNILTWKAIEEKTKSQYIIEQYRWERWVEIGTVKCVGKPQEQAYKFDLNKAVLRPYNGKNKYRLKQINYRKDRHSPEIIAKFKKPKAKIKKNDGQKLIEFSSATSYQILDLKEEKILLEGHAKKVDINKLAKGKYILRYDTKKTNFRKK